MPPKKSYYKRVKVHTRSEITDETLTQQEKERQEFVKQLRIEREIELKREEIVPYQIDTLLRSIHHSYGFIEDKKGDVNPGPPSASIPNDQMHLYADEPLPKYMKEELPPQYAHKLPEIA